MRKRRSNNRKDKGKEERDREDRIQGLYSVGTRRREKVLLLVLVLRGGPGDRGRIKRAIEVFCECARTNKERKCRQDMKKRKEKEKEKAMNRKKERREKQDRPGEGEAEEVQKRCRDHLEGKEGRA